MKKLITFIIAFLAIHQVSAQVNPFNTKDSTQVSGKIIGYDPQHTDHFITFSTYDIFGRATNQSIQIEDNGSFWIKLYQPFEGNMQLNYKEAYINIYTKPNENLQLDIYDSKIQRETNFEAAFVAKGKLANINNLIFKFSSAFNKHSFQAKSDMGNKTQTDSAFAESVIIKLNEQLTFLNAFIKDNQVTDQKFINWQRSLLQYEAGKEILFFPFAGKMNKEITQNQLLQFIKTIPINNSNAFNNSMYYEFLNILVGDFQIMININPNYNIVKAQTGKNKVDICLDDIDKFANGLAKQLMYYNIFLHKAGSGLESTPYLSRFNAVITNPFLNEPLLKGGIRNDVTFKKFDVVARLNALKVNPALKQRLITLFTQYKGMSLYIDFWGDWCGPCMSELPSYPRLISALEGKPIKFLFLSAFTTEESMLAIKKKFKIDGDFINLSKDEVAMVNNVFEFHSYPSHFMVSDEGEVISKMSKTSLGNVQQKAEEITRLLKK
ncbi:redoxin domain-containing protein [Pedobacter polaris]|uniref:Redoxin domain-containing protein n=1 Tax=Pedobacter polaris TaxID=2571273 RepID=A0A4U1CUM6_9SPHI|nr:redoxin domain-containing protein [Pedobacter polaris]TKC12574.1 redoxin domain-containing protein [Pedobacter polaris]